MHKVREHLDMYDLILVTCVCIMHLYINKLLVLTFMLLPKILIRNYGYNL